MTYDEFRSICEREWENGFGDVCEVHLDLASHDILRDSMTYLRFKPDATDTVSHVVNPVTATAAPLTVHRNHLVVKRAPQPAPTLHTVYLDV